MEKYKKQQILISSTHLDPYWEPCQERAQGSKSSRYEVSFSILLSQKYWQNIFRCISLPTEMKKKWLVFRYIFGLYSVLSFCKNMIKNRYKYKNGYFQIFVNQGRSQIEILQLVRQWRVKLDVHIYNIPCPSMMG